MLDYLAFIKVQWISYGTKGFIALVPECRIDLLAFHELGCVLQVLVCAEVIVGRLRVCRGLHVEPARC